MKAEESGKESGAWAGLFAGDSLFFLCDDSVGELALFSGYLEEYFKEEFSVVRTWTI